MTNFKKELELAKELAEATGAIQIKHLKDKHKIEYKSAFNSDGRYPSF